MTWEAHSFLCVSPDAVLTRHVQAVAGFSWGFAVSQHNITFARPAALGPEAWDSHLDLLAAEYPDWTFDRGYLPALPAPDRRAEPTRIAHCHAAAHPQLRMEKAH